MNNKKLILSVFWVILGAVLVILSVLEVLDSTFYAGLGGAFFAIGVLQVIRHLKYRSDTEYRDKVDIEMNDERNKFLSTMSWKWAGTITVIVEGIGAIIALILGHSQLQHILSESVCLIVFAYWVSYMVLSRRY